MAPRRSQRRAVEGSQLSDNFSDVEAQAKRQVLSEHRAARQAKYANTTTKFRFLDLLPELRIRIYALAISTNGPRCMTKAPTLALVSKQVRAEVLPVFFSECTFAIRLHSNYAHIRHIDALAAQNVLAGYVAPRRGRGMTLANSFDMVLIDSARAINETIYDRTRSAINKIHKRDKLQVAFRNVDFFILCQTVWPRRGVWGPAELSTFSLRVPTGKHTVEVISADPRGSQHLPALVKMRDQAKTIAEEMAASRKRFVGFTLAELDRIERAFKYWPA